LKKEAKKLYFLPCFFRHGATPMILGRSSGMQPESVFVSGTDTGIGKTVVAACLVHAFGARYWKPIQTGLADEPGDTHTVSWLAHMPQDRLHAPRYALRAPLSPEAAAQREGVRIALADFSLPAGEGPVVVEGAGGLLVPLGGGALMTDLIGVLGLPVVLVARSTLGTINHTLLSIEALARRNLPLRGVVLVGPDGGENAAAIARHSGARILAMLPWLERMGPPDVASLARMFGEPGSHEQGRDGGP
jgi:malonyl-CoA O-methyltransferase